MIHITDGQTDKILAVITPGMFWRDLHKQSLKDNLETFDFDTFINKPFSEYLAKRNRVIIPGENGNYIEFIIGDTYKRSDRSLTVYTSSSYIELAKAKVIYPQTLNGQTPSTVVDFAVEGTEWQRGIIHYTGTRTIDIPEHTNPYSFLKRMASELGLELRFRVEVDGNKVVGRYVDMVERIGDWQGREVEFGKDLVGIERKESNDVVTALVCLGPIKQDGTRIEVFLEDLDALKRWGRNGRHLVETYEPQSTNQGMTESELTTLGETELAKRVNSVVEYTGEIADLENVPGLKNKKIRFGDTIKIKDLWFDPPLYLEARVIIQERSISDKSQKKVTLGDYIEYTEDQVKAIWKSLQSDIAQKISMTEVLDMVYTKNETDGKDASVFQDGTIYAEGVSETAKQAAIDVAAQDATSKANTAENNSKCYTDLSLNSLVVDTAKINDASITTAKIGDGQITNAKIDRASVNKLVVVTADIQDAAINTAKIASAAIHEAHIGDAQITNAKIVDASIDSAKIQNGAITTAKIAVGAIDTALIQDSAIGTAQIADGSITDAKIIGLTANKITAGTIDAAYIEVINLRAANITVGTINGYQITNAAITNEKLAVGAVTGDKISPGAITADKIPVGTITESKMNWKTHFLC